MKEDIDYKVATFMHTHAHAQTSIYKHSYTLTLSHKIHTQTHAQTILSPEANKHEQNIMPNQLELVCLGNRARGLMNNDAFIK